MLNVNEKFLQDEEQLRLEVYDDATGLPLKPGQHPIGNATIGWGHKLAPNEHYPDGITHAQAETLFQRDVGIAISHINFLLNHPTLNANEMTAFVSLVFNCGSAPLLGTPGRYFLAGDRIECYKAFELYHHNHPAGQPCTKICPVLLVRRKKEEALALTAVA
jgi:GH24 family phage-related lysozyme (muramidase)